MFYKLTIPLWLLNNNSSDVKGILLHRESSELDEICVRAGREPWYYRQKARQAIEDEGK